MSLLMMDTAYRNRFADIMRQRYPIGDPIRDSFEGTPWETIDQAYYSAASSPRLTDAGSGLSMYGGGPITSSGILDTVSGWLGKAGGIIGILTGAGSPPAGPMPGKFPGLPSGMPQLPPGAGMPPLPSGGMPPLPSGSGATEAGMGGMILKAGRRVIPAVVAGIIGEWVYDTVKGWIFRKKKHRRMNVLNPRALVRADRRVTGFAHFAKKELGRFGYHVGHTRSLKHKAPALPRRKHAR